MIYWVIRHKATGELMPQMKRSRGYTNWNPNTNDPPRQALGVPRLFNKLRSANTSARLWVSAPNAYNGYYTSSYVEDIDDIITREDGRKKDDIEVIKVDLVFLDELNG